jgi:alanyl aminopeptidase
MLDHAAPSEVRGNLSAYARRLYRKRYKQLGWRARGGDSSDTKLLRQAVIQFMVMDVRDREARSRAARLGRSYAGYRTKANQAVVDPQLAGLVIAAAVQQGGEGLFEHLLGLLGSSTDATERSRILSALGHAEDPILSARALDLSLDPSVRVNEIGQLLGAQFRNSRTRDRAWTWLTEHFDALTDRSGTDAGGWMPWYAASFCSEEAAAEVQRFFEPRVAELGGGPRNLAGAVEAISLCAQKAANYRPDVEQTFGPRYQPH